VSCGWISSDSAVKAADDPSAPAATRDSRAPDRRRSSTTTGTVVPAARISHDEVLVAATPSTSNQNR